MKVCDYRDVEILPNSIIYADIPYKGTADYGVDFNYATFYEWAEAQKVPIFISEYEMPQVRFYCVSQWERVSTLSACNNALKKIEKLFIPMKWKDWWNEYHIENQQPKLNLFD